MSRNAKPRKAYRPKGVNPQAHVMAMLGASRVSVNDRLTWQLALQNAIEAVQKAQAKREEWAEIFDAINLVEQLLIDGYIQDPDKLIEAAQAVCVTVLDRQKASGVKAARASELATLWDVASAFGEAMSGLTNAERLRLNERLDRRIQHALRTRDPLLTRVVNVVEDVL
jgi:hypothetical protein